jgi:uncharacterized caspase-like protein
MIKRLFFVTLCLCVFSILSSPSLASKRVALVIGNGAYKTSPLKNPPNDAAGMAAILKKLDFDVVPLIDADKRKMIEAVELFGRKLSRSQVGLFYYAGHGMQIKGRNYLIPVNAHISAETDVELESVDVYRILGRMASAGNRTNVIILDACRENPFERAFRTSAEGLAKLDAPVGSVIAFATGPGDVAADGTGRNGLFTKHLLRNFSRPELSLTQVLMETRRGVVEETGKK